MRDSRGEGGQRVQRGRVSAAGEEAAEGLAVVVFAPSAEVRVEHGGNFRVARARVRGAGGESRQRFQRGRVSRAGEEAAADLAVALIARPAGDRAEHVGNFRIAGARG